MDLAKQAQTILERLGKAYTDTGTALNWSNPIELLVAVVLSAQCTDKRVNMVTADLFLNYKTARDFARADPEQFENDIRSTGFFRNKAKNIIGAGAIIDGRYNGRLPQDMSELVKLPGIGRKSANIILAEAFGVVEGIPVDTHVIRLTGRLGLTMSKDPEKIETEMMAIVPREDWYRFSTLLIYHGRAVCKARKPECDRCVLEDICPSAHQF